MAKFNLTPSTFDKLKGNTILVKKDELGNFADFCKEKIKREEELEQRVKELEEENQKLKRQLNKQILDEEVGRDSVLVKLEKENQVLKKQLFELQDKFQTMESLYLKKIEELMNEEQFNSNEIKRIMSNTVKEAIKKEFEKLQEPIIGESFVVEI